MIAHTYNKENLGKLKKMEGLAPQVMNALWAFDRDLRELQHALPPKSTDAMICAFECTFSLSCVENILDNVCPNCGGGFVPA
jgi:hypothetical protein